jgi:LysR substrate binding domain
LASCGSELGPSDRLVASLSSHLGASGVVFRAPGGAALARSAGVVSSRRRSIALAQDRSFILQCFHEHHPGVDVRVVARETPTKLQGLLDGGLDSALLRAAPRVAGVDTLELWRERLVAVMSRRHPLADGADASIAELARYPVILASRERNPWAREQAERLFADAGVAPVLGPMYSTLQETLAMIARSEAWT